MPVPTILEIAVSGLSAVLLTREIRAIIKESKAGQNGNSASAAIQDLAALIGQKEVKDTERHGNVVGHIKDSERRLAERISDIAK